MKPTGEQQDAIDAFRSGGRLALEAGAGTGKTTALMMLADAAGSRRGVYIAYNRAIANDARTKMPSGVTVATAHSIAYGAIGRRYRDRLNAPRIPARRVAAMLGITGPLHIGDGKTLPAPALARIANETVQRFCYTADREIGEQHVPITNGVEDHRVFADVVVPLAQRVWTDLQRPRGDYRFSHDTYLKMFELSEPVLDYDYLLLDEAQDTNGAVASIVQRQAGQQVVVGDAQQALYTWRGASNFLSVFPAEHRLALSTSFRFGPAIADEANKWLALLDADLRLTGAGGPSELGEVVQPDVVLCRTNAEAVAQMLAAQAENVRVALVGGANDIKRLAEAAMQLQTDRFTTHPELVAFRSWPDVREYVERGGGGDLRAFVRLIDDHTPETVIEACDQTVPEESAGLVVSTAHRAKGREWQRVRIAGDFQPSDGEDEFARPEMMLAYVAVTRARRMLDRGSLALVDRLITDRTPAATHTAAAPEAPDVTVTITGDLATRLRAFAATAGLTPERAATRILDDAIDEPGPR